MIIPDRKPCNSAKEKRSFAGMDLGILKVHRGNTDGFKSILLAFRDEPVYDLFCTVRPEITVIDIVCQLHVAAKILQAGGKRLNGYLVIPQRSIK
jgi:hypothetical protein